MRNFDQYLRETYQDPTRRAAAWRYYDIDPRKNATEARVALQDVRETLRGCGGLDMQTANILSAANLELALVNGRPAKHARQLIRAARDGVKQAAGVPETLYEGFDVQSFLRSLRQVGLSYLFMDRSAAGRRNFASQSTQRLEQLLALHDTAHNRRTGVAQHIAGFCFEETIHILFNTPQATERGLAAYPSMERHDSNRWLVDGLVYRWDVTVESDGSVLPAGEYRVQAKKGSDPSDLKGYHPDIAVLSAAIHLGDNPYLGNYHVAARDLLDHNNDAITAHLDSATHVLEATGRAADPQLIFA